MPTTCCAQTEKDRLKSLVVRKSSDPKIRSSWAASSRNGDGGAAATEMPRRYSEAKLHTDNDKQNEADVAPTRDFMDSICTRRRPDAPVSKEEAMLDSAIVSVRPPKARQSSPDQQDPLVLSAGMNWGTSLFYKLLHELAQEHERELEHANGCHVGIRIPRSSFCRTTGEGPASQLTPGAESSSPQRAVEHVLDGNKDKRASLETKISCDKNSLGTTGSTKPQSSDDYVLCPPTPASVTNSNNAAEDLCPSGQKDDVQTCEKTLQADPYVNQRDQASFMNSVAITFEAPQVPHESSTEYKESVDPVGDSCSRSQDTRGEQVLVDKRHVDEQMLYAQRQEEDSFCSVHIAGSSLDHSLPHSPCTQQAQVPYGTMANVLSGGGLTRQSTAVGQQASLVRAYTEERVERGVLSMTTDKPELHDMWQYFLLADPVARSGSISQNKQLKRMALKRSDSGVRESAGTFSIFISNPASKRRLCWDVLGVILLAFDLVWIPLQAFEIQATNLLEYLQLSTTIFWTLDLVSCFFVGYHKQGVVEMRLQKIAVHYLRTWFCLDFCLVSMDLVGTLLRFGNASQASTFRIGKVTRGLRALKVLRLVKFRAVVGDLMSMLRSDYTRTLISILKIIVFIVFVNHYIACGFYWLHGTAENSGKTWVAVNFASTENDCPEYRYFTALHWSLTQFTPASMEVVPVNLGERIYTVLVLLFALVTFSSFVSSITTAMTHLRHINSIKLDQDSKLLKYLSDHRISSPLTSRVLHFFQERAKQGKGNLIIKEEDVELFQVLPESMKHELRWEAHKPILIWHPLFRVFFEYDDIAVREICNVLSERQLMGRDELFGHAAQVSHMFFVNSGKLSYDFTVNGIATGEAIEKGSWACEICLWVKKPIDSNPFVAQTQCDLVMLWCDSFKHIVDMHPSFAPQLAHYAQHFVQIAGELAERCRMQTVLMNNAEDVRDIVKTTIEKDNAIEGGLERDVSLSTCRVSTGDRKSRVDSRGSGWSLFRGKSTIKRNCRTFSDPFAEDGKFSGG